MRLLEGVNSKEEKVGGFAREGLVGMVVDGEKGKAMDCWISLMIALEENTLRDCLKEILAQNKVVAAVKELYAICKEQAIEIPNFYELLLEPAYASFLKDLMQQSTLGEFEIRLLTGMLENPKIEYFEKLSQLYGQLVTSQKNELLIKSLNILRLHRSIPLKTLEEKSDQGYYNLSETCKALENNLTEQKP